MRTIKKENNGLFEIEQIRYEYFRTEITLGVLGLRNVTADGSLLYCKERVRYRANESGEEFYAETGDLFPGDSPEFILTTADGVRLGNFPTKSKITKFLRKFVTANQD